MAKQNVSLRDWINANGVQAIAELLGVEDSAVRHWRRGHCLPRAEQMREIKRVSKGQVSYESMIDVFFEARK